MVRIPVAIGRRCCETPRRGEQVDGGAGPVCFDSFARPGEPQRKRHSGARRPSARIPGHVPARATVERRRNRGGRGARRGPTRWRSPRRAAHLTTCTAGDFDLAAPRGVWRNRRRFTGRHRPPGRAGSPLSADSTPRFTLALSILFTRLKSRRLPAVRTGPLWRRRCSQGPEPGTAVTPVCPGFTDGHITGGGIRATCRVLRGHGVDGARFVAAPALSTAPRPRG